MTDSIRKPFDWDQYHAIMSATRNDGEVYVPVYLQESPDSLNPFKHVCERYSDVAVKHDLVHRHVNHMLLSYWRYWIEPAADSPPSTKDER